MINMKIKSFLFVFILLNGLFLSNLYSQKYDIVDKIVDGYPKNLSNTDQLISLINKDFTSPNEKARAVFTWVASNISYDISLSESMNHASMKAFSYKNEKEKEVKEKKFKMDLVNTAMSTKKAVCHGYAALVEYLYLKLGLETKIILGHLRTDPSEIGEMPNVLNHAWNVVKIEGKWQFVDTTLASGYISSKTNLFTFHFNDGYFFTTPEKFFLNHYPIDEKWLLIPESKIHFAQLPVFYGSYFQLNYQITKPESGICTTLNNKNFTFAIRGLDQYDTVEYSSSIDNRITYLEQENNKLDYIIPLVGKENSFISIYVNRKIIAIYKII